MSLRILRSLIRRVDAAGPYCGASTSRYIHVESASKASSSAAPRQSKQQMKSRRKEQNELRKKLQEITKPDPVLGYVRNDKGEKFWKSSDLYKILLSKDDVWGVREDRRGNLVKIDDEKVDDSQLGPKRLNFGLDDKDSRRLLFSDLLEINCQDQVERSNLASVLDKESVGKIEAIEEDEAGRSEQLGRILDLKNASGKGIQVDNTRRIIQEFSHKKQGQIGLDSGSVEVQTAILTYRIRNLYEHLQDGHRHDNHNRRGMTLLVHKRARLLKYLRRESLPRYEALLPRLGLKRRAVEGEIVVPGKPRMQIDQ